MMKEDLIRKISTKNILFREGKVTPKKKGLFVTLWKRDAEGNTCPFDSSDPYDYVIINVHNVKRSGAFIFPKDVLVKNRIFSHQDITGKRAFRLYPPWENELNQQATKSQEWQIRYFVENK
ncbi:MAG: MepB family protein [Deltaproteobacteria bacterium]|nr:MepB family protein [Deltaproteobacteria bacterium]